MFSTSALAFHSTLSSEVHVPAGIGILNPFVNPTTMQCIEKFYHKYYMDTRPRVGVFGINPGRFGAGLTGISFTDPVALRNRCGIDNDLGLRAELSSEFVYRCIDAFGGAQAFFAAFYLSAVCPLGFVSNDINYNFYDSVELQTLTTPFIIKSLHAQLAFPLRHDIAICLGSGKLKKFMLALNDQEEFFERIVFLDHPRFIMQYRRAQLAQYIEAYCETFRSCLNGAQQLSSPPSLQRTQAE